MKKFIIVAFIIVCSSVASFSYVFQVNVDMYINGVRTQYAYIDWDGDGIWDGNYVR